MPEIDMSWKDIAAFVELAQDKLVPVSIGDEPIILVRKGNAVTALGGKCPHKGAPLEGGTLCDRPDGEAVVVCPWHKAVFSAASGRLLEPLALDPLPNYPVEIHDGRVLVGLTPRASDAPPPMRESETVAIIGAGAGGVTAAVTLRQHGFAGRILLVGPEPELPYDRTALSKMVLSSKPEDLKIPPLRPSAFYEENNIERIEDIVTNLDIPGRTIRMRDNDSVQADHILLATGSKPVQLDLPGSHLRGVSVLRTAQDARDIVEEAGPGKTAVIVGDSFIALEAAAALRRRGVGVTVVSRNDIPFESKFGREIGQRMRELHEENGVAFVPDCNVTALTGMEKVEQVHLDDGTVLNADFVLAGIGVGPVSDYVSDHHRADDGGIEVDEHMRVAPGVYAVGDIASFPHADGRLRIEHWRTAQCQARIAARAMLGLPVEPLPTPWFWTQQYDQKLEYVGWPAKFDSIDFEGDLDQFDFMAKLKKDGRTIGMIGSRRAQAIGKACIDFGAS